MAGLLEIVVILWRSIHRSMENNKEARVYTVSKFASMLPEYMKAFKVRRATLLRQACQVLFVQDQPLDLLLLCRGGD